VTSVVVDKNGLATVMGDGPAYFVLADHAPEVCQPGVPLTYSNFKIWKVPAGGTFDLKNRPTTGYYLRSVTNGVINADPY
jgi:cyanophycinase-like exopeptidase